jgi:O-antigen ligase
MALVIDEKPASPWWLVVLGALVAAAGLYVFNADDASDWIGLAILSTGGLLATAGAVGVGVAMGTLRADWSRGHRWKDQL